MQLKNLLVTDKEVELEYPDTDLEGFKVKIAYLPRAAVQKISKKCTVTKYSKKTHQPEEELNGDLFLDLYVKSLIKGWSGLKYSYLLELMAVDLGDTNLEDELEYNEENALILMKNSSIFDKWITDVTADISVFNTNS